jgi:glycosyltransferase involved in cell wall biosynthesis
MYGPEQTILGFCRALPEFGYTCSIGLIHRPMPGSPEGLPMQEEAQASGIPFVHWSGEPLRIVAMSGQLRNYVAKHPVDIVHAHDYKANWMALLAFQDRRSGPALVSTPRHSESGSLLRLLQGLDSKLLHRFDLITEASPEACARIRLYPGIAERVRLVRHGVDRHGVEASGREAERLLPKRDGQFVVLIAARLEAVKGHKLFLEAMEMVARRVTNVQLWLAGEGSLENELKRYTQDLGLSEHVRFLGYRPDMANVFRQADVAVVASNFETSCRAAMEALAFGCPLVATPVGIIPELSDEGRTIAITPHGNAARMADAVLRILQDSALAQRMRERGQAKVQDSGGHRAAAATLASVYEEALARR